MILSAGRKEEYKHELSNILKSNGYHLHGKETLKELERQFERYKRKVESENGRR